MNKNDFLASLPPDANAHRVLRTKETAAFLGISEIHLRRLNRLGSIPAPLRLSERRLGWRLGDLISWLESRPRDR